MIKYLTSGVLSSLCALFHKPFKRHLFSSADSGMKNFIANDILPITTKRKSKQVLRTIMTYTTDAVVNAINHKSLLQNQFKSKYNQVISSNKTCTDEFCFSVLGYFTISARRTREMNDISESARLSETREAYGKLHCTTSTELQGTSRGSMAQFHVVFGEDVASITKFFRHKF